MEHATKEDGKESFNILKDMKSGSSNLNADDYILNFFSLVCYSCVAVFLLTVNFISLSCCLHINKGTKMSGKILSIIFSFLFGFIYFTVFILGNHIGRKKKTITFDKNNMFPFD
jgi:lipopolysaccharide export LptBFGC system permease protein LptF